MLATAAPDDARQHAGTARAVAGGRLRQLSMRASASARPRPADWLWHRSSPSASGGTGRQARARHLSRSRQAQGRRHKARSAQVASRAVLDASSTWAFVSLPAGLTHLHEAGISPASKASRAAQLRESPYANCIPIAHDCSRGRIVPSLLFPSDLILINAGG